jgi:hypothetical protein
MAGLNLKATQTHADVNASERHLRQMGRKPNDLSAGITVTCGKTVIVQKISGIQGVSGNKLTLYFRARVLLIITYGSYRMVQIGTVDLHGFNQNHCFVPNWTC